MKRRVVKAGGILLACAAVAVACSGPDPGTESRAGDPCYVGPVQHTEIPIVPSSMRPPPFDASRLDTQTPIKHVVFIMKENRTFDHLFGAFPGADGAAAGMRGDEEIDLRAHCFAQVLPRDILHDYPAALDDWNEGKMDGFGGSGFADEWAFTQASAKDIPNYWHWAESFSLGDNFFSSVLGPSFPNHLYSIAGTAWGTHDNPVQSKSERVSRAGAVIAKTWGCDAPNSMYVLVDRDPGPGREPGSYWRERNPTKEDPCFGIRVFPDVLKQARIPWAYYGADDKQEGYFWTAPNYIKHIREDPVNWGSHVFGVNQLVPDIQDGRLPPVTWVTPQFWQSDHPDASICLGENWTTQIVNAVMEGPMWEDTVIFIAWDDWGGFYDHVPPPEGLGFRVPVLTISPFSKRGYIDPTEGDFSSIIRFMEYNWKIEASTRFDVEVKSDMTQNFDFTQEPLPPDPLPLRNDCQSNGDMTSNEGDTAGG